MSVAARYDQLAPTYDQHFTRPIDRAEDAVLAKVVGPTKGLALLDLGCGTGHLLDTLPDKPYRYTGVDLSIGMLNVAHQQHSSAHLFSQQHWLRADVCDDNWTVDPADVTVALWSWSYFTEPNMAAWNAYRFTRVGGRLVVLAYTERYRHRPSHLTPDLPFTTYTPKGLTSELSSAGWSGVQVSPFRVLPDAAAARLPYPVAVNLVEAEMNLPVRYTNPYALLATAVRMS